MASVSLQHVWKRFRLGRPAVQDLSLEIRDGEFVSLVGPSGCGKSTTLNLIAGLEAPSEGEIRIDDVPVNGLPPGRRDVAMVFQSYALYPHLDVRGNLAFPLKVAGVPQREIDPRVQETAQLLGLEGLLDRRPAQLSGGQRQRMALGRALVRRPKAFLFDEPLSNLDAGLRMQMRGELKKLHARLGATFIYVTHDQAEAMTLSDRIAVLREGVLQQVGPPREIYDHPANVFVAEFFGAPRINLASPRALSLEPASEELRVGIRPEDVEVGVGDPPPGALLGKIDLVEPMGAETWVTVALPAASLTARAPAAFFGSTGAPAWVRINRERLHWFDVRSGQRRLV